ncbi:Xenotropic and polytropic retrovirus receptor 1 [Goodea atripinnis]|uniref:Xenotropic and polytropic retrovirus receptor 1 n=1 Tax=Goodea atripinnis TaxID=208336 RepID=A0ABV0ND14_9TELE
MLSVCQLGCSYPFADNQDVTCKHFFIILSVEKLAEAQRRFATLQNELQSSLDAQRENIVLPGLRKRKTMFHLSQEERCKHHNIKDLKLAFSEFYLSLILLQNYQVLSTHAELSLL